MARNQRDGTYDHSLLMKDAGLVAADGVTTVASAERIITLGDGLFEGKLVVDVTALEVASGNETYRIKTQFSDSATFASGVIGGAQVDLADSSLLIGESADSAIGRYEIPFSNQINGVIYSYMRVYVDVGGTIATGINFIAYVLPR